MIKHLLWNRLKLMEALCLAVLLTVTACSAKTKEQGSPAPAKTTNSTKDTSPSPVGIQMDSSVNLRIRKQADETVIVALENNTDRPIFVSYIPPMEGDTTTFLSYGLEQRKSDGSGFKSYGPDIHFIPKLNSIAPRTVVLFNLLTPPTEKGEYRVFVTYYDNADIYKLVNEKASNLSSNELDRIKQASKVIRSDSFIVASKRTNK